MCCRGRRVFNEVWRRTKMRAPVISSQVDRDRSRSSVSVKANPCLTKNTHRTARERTLTYHRVRSVLIGTATQEHGSRSFHSRQCRLLPFFPSPAEKLFLLDRSPSSLLPSSGMDRNRLWWRSSLIPEWTPKNRHSITPRQSHLSIAFSPLFVPVRMVRHESYATVIQQTLRYRLIDFRPIIIYTSDPLT